MKANIKGTTSEDLKPNKSRKNERDLTLHRIDDRPKKTPNASISQILGFMGFVQAVADYNGEVDHNAEKEE